jgi:hypothetical protein
VTPYSLAAFTWIFQPNKRFKWPGLNQPERKENRTLAVLTMVEWDGVTQQQYEALRQFVNWEGDSPKGLSFHVAAFDEKGGHFVDLWETAEEFQSFIEGRLVPGAKQVGMQGEPRPQMYPARALFTPGYRSA